MQNRARGEKLISLEIARFLAALSVAIEHLSTTVQTMGVGHAPLTMPAPAAVTFFFTLSGFVIYNAHYQDAGKPARIARYFWRRIWRVYPVYWLSLAPMLYYFWPVYSAGYIVKILTLSPFFGNIAEVNPPAWSLRWEVGFYLIFGLALLPYARRVLLPAWAFLVLWRWYPHVLGLQPAAAWLQTDNPLLAQLSNGNNMLFIMGLAAGAVFVRWRPPAWVLWPLLGIAAVLLVAELRLDSWGTQYSPSSHKPVAAGGFAAVIFALAALERGGHLRVQKRFAALGNMSYPLYLLHPGIGFLFVVNFFFHPAHKQHFTAWPLFLLLLGLSLLASGAVAFLFDAPLQRLARRIA